VGTVARNGNLLHSSCPFIASEFNYDNVWLYVVYEKITTESTCGKNGMYTATSKYFLLMNHIKHRYFFVFYLRANLLSW
jgi:hypothetical protein